MLEKFWELELPDELLTKYNLRQLTKQDKALILGGNYARIVGLDVERAKQKIANDEFARERRETGISGAVLELAGDLPEAEVVRPGLIPHRQADGPGSRRQDTGGIA